MFISTFTAFTAFTAGLVYFELNSYVFMAQTEPSVSEPNLAKTEKLLRYGIGIMVQQQQIAEVCHYIYLAIDIILNLFWYVAKGGENSND